MRWLIVILLNCKMVNYIITTASTFCLLFIVYGSLFMIFEV